MPEVAEMVCRAQATFDEFAARPASVGAARMPVAAKRPEVKNSGAGTAGCNNEGPDRAAQRECDLPIGTQGG